MNALRPVIGTTALALLLGVAGCASVPADADSHVVIGRDEYHPVFKAAIDVLREMRFTVDRADRRFGVVTTEPLIASSLFEPWYRDNTTARQVAESTLNHQRRTVRVTIEPATAPDADAVASDEAATDTDETPADAEATNDYVLRVDVAVERRQQPQRRLTTAAFAEVDYRRGSAGRPTLMTETGAQQPRWRRIGDDPHLARRLASAIVQRSVETTRAERAAEAASPAPEPDDGGSIPANPVDSAESNS